MNAENGFILPGYNNSFTIVLILYSMIERQQR